MMLVPERAQAGNDYMEQKSHYSVYVAGSDHIHAKIPVWVEGGRDYDYHATPPDDDYSASYIYYKVDNQVYRIGYWQADCKDRNDNDNGMGDLQFLMAQGENRGTVIISKHDGTKVTFSGYTGSWSDFIIVNQGKDDGYSQVTWLELDWYMPASLAGKKFYFGIHSEFERCYTVNGRYHYSKDWT